MNNPLISIIVPVYNTGNVLCDTINSILAQTYKNFELILVDDGSTDGSSNVCDEYARKDTRVIVHHKINGGICDARNYGMQEAKGEYIAFCDHDDLFLPILLEKAIETAIKYDADVVKWGRKVLYDNGKPTIILSIDNIEVFNQERIKRGLLDLINKKGFPLSVIWNGIYNKRLIQENKVIFSVNMKHGGEDFDFILKLIPLINNMVIIPNVLYVHFLRKELSTSEKLYDDILNNFFVEVQKVSKLLSHFKSEKINQSPEYKYFYTKKVFEYVSYAIRMKKDKKDIVNELNKFYNSTFNDNSCSLLRFIHYVGISKWMLLLYIYFIFKNKRFGYLIEFIKISKSISNK